MKPREEQGGTSNIEFNLMSFRAMTWPEWVRRYRTSTRAIVKLSRIEPTRMKLSAMGPDDVAYLVWYSTGDWMKGIPRQFSPGTRNCLVRLPAFEYRGRVLIIDGMHRLTQLRPRFVLLDVAVLSKNQICYVADMHNEFWRRSP